MSRDLLATPEPAARLEDVVKRYGRTRALDGLSLTIPRGSICALVGPNGSGKTTTMGVVAGLLRPTSGSVQLLGQYSFDVRLHSGKVSVMPQDSVPSSHVPIEDSLIYFARLQGISPAQARQQAASWLSRVQLTDRRRSKYGALSHGMRRRFSVAQAMMGAPELILLDEPTSGLDPELVVDIRRIIVEHRGRATVLVSSHILSELETMCDHAIFLERGRCTRQGPMSELTGRDTVVRFLLNRRPDLEALGAAMKNCRLSMDDATLTIRAPSDQSVADTNAVCLRWLLDHGIGVLSLVSGESLESAYLASKDRV